MQADLLPRIQQQLAIAKDGADIAATRRSLEAIGANDANVARPLWTAYRKGLSDWMHAATDVPPAPLPTSAELPPSIFTSPKLRRVELAAAIYPRQVRDRLHKGRRCSFLRRAPRPQPRAILSRGDERRLHQQY